LISTQAGSLATVRLLLDAGADLEAESDEKSPLFVAVRQKRCDIAAALLEKGADAGHCVASAGLCPIHAATSPDRLACLTALLAHGADPNAFDAYGTTPLRVAAIKGDEMGIINKEIIKAGANAKMDEQYSQWLKDHPEAQSPAPPEMAGEEL
jgi:ankyrin repeat protein